MNLPEIRISRRDFGRLDSLLGGTLLDRMGKVGEFLLNELARAKVVSDHELPPTVVAMNSTVRFRDEESGRETVAKLTFPGETSPETPCVSVLTPVGAALLGLSQGDSITYETPDGRLKTLTVIEVITHRSDGGSSHEAAVEPPAGGVRTDGSGRSPGISRL